MIGISESCRNIIRHGPSTMVLHSRVCPYNRVIKLPSFPIPGFLRKIDCVIAIPYSIMKIRPLFLQYGIRIMHRREIKFRTAAGWITCNVECILRIIMLREKSKRTIFRKNGISIEIPCRNCKAAAATFHQGHEMLSLPRPLFPAIINAAPEMNTENMYYLTSGKKYELKNRTAIRETMQCRAKRL